jgi:hypothetical protein
MNFSTTVTRLTVLLLLIVSTKITAQTLFQLLPSKTTNVKFSNTLDETEKLNVLAYEYFYNGGGVAVGDINNDGLQDLYFTANMMPNKLYLNLGNMKFKDITKDVKGIEGKKDSWKTGVTMADVNGDGLLDIYVCYSGKFSDAQRRNQLFINKGNLKFEEQAAAYGLDDPGYSTHAVFFDYDNDGDLDMFLLNHNVKKIDNMELAQVKNQTDSLASNKLFRNDGNRFTDVSQKAGIIQNPLTFGLGIAVADVNGDGWQDVYVTNDYNEPDYCYINKHDGTFKEDSKSCFRHLSQFSMGVDIADFNNDGLPDIMTLDMLPENNTRQKLLQLQESYEMFELMQSQDLYKQYMRNMLQLNNGDGTFSEIGQMAGVSNTDWSWCPLIADFDNDGYKDIFITNGYLRDYTNKDFLKYWGDYKVKKAMDREPTKLMDVVTAMPSTTLKKYIYRNKHDLTFTNMQKDWGMEKPGISSGAIYADLDNDGDLDLVVNNVDDEASIYQNMSRENNHTSYISLKLKGNGANTNAIGAKVFVYANGLTQFQEVNPTRGYLSSVSTQLLFGLGEATKIDSIRIVWPDNKVQHMKAVAANQLLKVDYTPDATYAMAVAKPGIFSKTAGIIDYKHVDNNWNDFKRQLLMTFMYSKTGPIIAKADVNKDGLEDLFISGDNDKPGKIYLQQKNGSFTVNNKTTLEDETETWVSDAAFFDANGDGFPDLYLAMGGYGLLEPNTPGLQDQLYLNDGKGNFYLTKASLPDVSGSSKSCVRPCDFDNDGDIDLFVGGRVIPGQYPVAPVSYLLVNNGKGQFTISEVPFAKVGMITDAQWSDLDKDGRKDLVLCGEFMPITVFANKTSGFTDKTADYFDQAQGGFWFSLSLTDVDGDGHDDIIAGNLGMNTQIHTSAKEPAELYYGDFDKNGSMDPFLNFYVQGVSYPFVSRDELNDQIYPMRRKFSSYKNYSTATMKEILAPEDITKVSKLTVNETRTMCFLYKNGKFVPAPLPLQAQFSIVSKIITGDFNHDGKVDLLLFGNHSDNRLKLGSIDAGYGCLLKGNGKGDFSYVDQLDAGLSVKGDVKSASAITINDKNYVIVGVNNEGISLYKEK